MSIFENVVNRTSTRSVKWDWRKKLFNSEEVIPMWIADMDFQTSIAIKEALIKRVEHGIFGYTATDKELSQTIINWVKKRYNWTIEEGWIKYSPAVIPSLHMIVQSLTEKGDKIVIQTPVYPPFYDVIKQHHRVILKNSLIFNGSQYKIDFKALEETFKQGVKLFILCNPHNPVGRVWKRDELLQLANLCIQYDVIIASDEIHADLIYPDHEHIPIATTNEEIADQTITLMSPTKTFNLAGLQVSYLITSNKKMRAKISNQFNRQGIFMINTLGLTAMDAAYQHGEEWLESLLDILNENKNYVIKNVHAHTDKIKVIEPEGTYLLWLDCRKMNLEKNELKTFMQNEAKVGLNEGSSFGEEGEGFMRINIACPKKTLQKGVNRIISAVNRLDSL